MKKTLVKFGLLLASANFIMAACSDYDSNDINTSTRINTDFSNKIRSYEDALKIAQASISMLNDSKTSTRGVSNTRKIDLDNSKKVVKFDTKTRSDLGVNDTLIYVFNFENNEGFALISASKKTEGLLAITEKGHCDPDTCSEINGFEDFLEYAKEYVAESINKSINNRIIDPTDPILETKDSVVNVSRSFVGPYVNVMWGQIFPEGELCPNYISGCANTAMAQIMSYFCYPTSILMTFVGESGNTQTLNWTNMKAHATGHHRFVCSSYDTHISISNLLRQLGEWNHSDYSNYNSTSTVTETYLCSTFTNLGYTVGNWQNYKGTIARSELNNQHLLFIYGGIDNFNYHDWVFDGYQTQIETIYVMNRTASLGWYFTGEQYTRTTYFNHFNWGWYGENNGYFNENVYNTALVNWPDTTNNNATYNLSYGVKILSVYH